MDHDSRWRRSSRCDNSSGNWVEVAWFGGEVAIRDSAAPTFVLAVSAADFAAFVAGAKAGEFD